MSSQYYYHGGAYPQYHQQAPHWQNHHESSSWASQSPQRGEDYYQRVEEQANLQAQKLTLEYLRQAKLQRQSNDSSDCGKPSEPQPMMEENSEKVFIVFKFIHTPLEAIIAGM